MNSSKTSRSRLQREENLEYRVIELENENKVLNKELRLVMETLVNLINEHLILQQYFDILVECVDVLQYVLINIFFNFILPIWYRFN